MRAHLFIALTALGLAVVPIARAQLQGGASPPPPAATATPGAPTGPYAPYPPPPTYAPYPPPTYAPYPPQPPPGYSPYPYGAPPPAPNAPKQLDYEEGQPIPAGYHLKQKVRLGPVIGGACTFGVLWLISLMASSIGSALKDDHVAELWIPVAGPFITLGKVSGDSGSKQLLVIDGVGQAIGAGLFIWGITTPRTVLLRNDIAGIEVHAVPMLTAKSAGLGLGGQF